MKVYFEYGETELSYLQNKDKRLSDIIKCIGHINRVVDADVPKLQSLGMTFRKAEYITDFATKVHTGVFDLDAVEHMSDEDAIRELSALKGIGVWISGCT